MDDLDFGIVRQMAHPHTVQWDVRLSYASIARAVGADEETVRTRVRRLEDAGVIRGWDVGVNPSVFGRAFVRYSTPPVPEGEKDRVRAALVALDGARMLFETYPDRFAVVAHQEIGPATERQAALVAAVAGGPPVVSPAPLPAATVDLAPADWRIVAALRRDARRPYAEVASDAGVSERTLRRRVERLTEGRAIMLDPDLALDRMDGVVPCMLHVVLRDPARRADVDRELKALPRIVFTAFHERDSRVSFFARSVAEVEATRRRVQSLDGVELVRADIQLKRELLSEWLDHEVEKRAKGA